MKRPLLGDADRWCLIYIPDTLRAAKLRLYLARIHFRREVEKEIKRILKSNKNKQK